jgi:ACT domain-containing protein
MIAWLHLLSGSSFYKDKDIINRFQAMKNRKVKATL